MRALGLLVALGVMVMPLTGAVLNPSFEFGSPGAFGGSNLGVISSPATDWGGWNNTAVPTLLELLPTTLPLASAGSQMLHVSSTGDNNGVYQFFGGSNYYLGAWVYLNSGSMNLWLVGGSPVTTSLLNQWHFVQYNSPVSSNEVALYTGSAGGDFYIDLVTLDTNAILPESLPGVPEPGTMVMLGAGAVLLGLRRRLA